MDRQFLLHRDNPLRAATLCAWLSLIVALHWAEPLPLSAQSAGAGGPVRIENELKLSVPDEQAEAVWRYLRQRYGEEGFLKQIDPGFEVTFSEEFFADRYFDTPNLDLLKQQGGIRHRARRIPDNPSHEKHGRQLVQIKLRRTDNEASRTEIKFHVERRRPSSDPLGRHRLLGIIEKDEREAFLDAVQSIGLQPGMLRNTLNINQRRRRVYISLDSEPFATITLDEVRSRKWWKTVRFVEVEMELNEVGYTAASAQQRAAMEKVNRQMKQDLLAAFPKIVQNQTPKYNKVYDRFRAEYLFFPVSLRTGLPCELLLAGLGLLLAAVVATETYRRFRGRIYLKKPAPGRRTPIETKEALTTT